MTKLTLIVIAGALAASGAAAKDKAPVDPDKRICRRYETTGSIIGYRYECHTRSEWVKVDQGNNDIARSANDPEGRFGGFGRSLTGGD